jgi:hypothetical protein
LPASKYPARPGSGPCPAGPAPPPTLHRLRWIYRCRGLPSRIHRCCDLPGSICRPFGRIASSRLDLSQPCLPGRIRGYPFYSAAGADTMTGADACSAVGLPGGAPRHLDDQRSKKVGLPMLFCSVALHIVDARTSTPPEEQTPVACLPTTATSTSANSASRGYRLLGIHTDLFSNRNIHTITTLRL